jgi:hypothetical protein
MNSGTYTKLKGWYSLVTVQTNWLSRCFCFPTETGLIMCLYDDMRLICLHGSYWGLSWWRDLESILPALESEVEVKLDVFSSALQGCWMDPLMQLVTKEQYQYFFQVQMEKSDSRGHLSCSAWWMILGQWMKGNADWRIMQVEWLICNRGSWNLWMRQVHGIY